jgi:hypothetical protein
VKKYFIDMKIMDKNNDIGHRLDKFITLINSSIFLKEFTFGKNEFIPEGNLTYELADNFLWLDEYIVIFQNKKRNPLADSYPNSLINWYDSNILVTAKDQIDNSIDYFKNFKQIKIENERGHKFNVNTENVKKIYKVILYDCESKLPEKYNDLKYCKSENAGFIHIFKLEDYILIANTLYNPAEILDYLEFREKYLSLILNSQKYYEKHILGRYFLSPRVPNYQYDVDEIEFSEYVDILLDKRNKKSLSKILNSLFENKYQLDNPVYESEYYETLLEIAMQNRTYLEEFIKRFKYSKETVRKNENVTPCRFINLKRKVGFVFIPLSNEYFEKRQIYLRRYTELTHYELKLNKCIGIVFVSKEYNIYIDYFYIEGDWSENPEYDKILKENYPFGELKSGIRATYKFTNN